MQTQTQKNDERTCRSLFDQFKDKYTVLDVEKNPELAKLFTYLQHRCSMANGNYIHEPKENIASLLRKYLGYTTKNPTPEGEANFQIHAAQK